MSDANGARKTEASLTGRMYTYIAIYVQKIPKRATRRKGKKKAAKIPDWKAVQARVLRDYAESFALLAAYDRGEATIPLDDEKD